MDLESSCAQLNRNEVDVNEPEVGLNSSHETQIAKNEIFKSTIGKSCHQCRQKTKEFGTSCKSQRNGKPCVIKFCSKCLLNRYGEKAEEVEISDDWICPKCRGICNCSCCMKKRGKQPTGRLVRTAKASGFNSVSEMLVAKDSGDLESTQDNTASIFSKKEPTFIKEKNSADSSRSDKQTEAKVGKYDVKSKKQKVDEEIPLPPSTPLTKIIGIEFPPEDVGNALQFLEFYRVFGKVIDVEHEDGSSILRELMHMENSACEQNNKAIQFQRRLLTLILEDSKIESLPLTTTAGKNSWLNVLHDLVITKSNLVLKEFPTDCLNERISGYYNLSSSIKLSLLNFICDEALGTKVLKSFIDEQIERFNEEKKQAKSKVFAAKKKEKGLKQQLKNEMDKDVTSNSNGDNLSVSDHKALLSTLKIDAAQARMEMLEAKGTIFKRNQSYDDAVRIEPEFSDCNGHTFWKLKSYDGENVLLKDFKIHIEDGAAADEKWFGYGPEHNRDIDKYISSRPYKMTSIEIRNLEKTIHKDDENWFGYGPKHNDDISKYISSRLG